MPRPQESIKPALLLAALGCVEEFHQSLVGGSALLTCAQHAPFAAGGGAGGAQGDAAGPVLGGIDADALHVGVHLPAAGVAAEYSNFAPDDAPLLQAVGRLEAPGKALAAPALFISDEEEVADDLSVELPLWVDVQGEAFAAEGVSDLHEGRDGLCGGEDDGGQTLALPQAHAVCLVEELGGDAPLEPWRALQLHQEAFDHRQCHAELLLDASGPGRHLVVSQEDFDRLQPDPVGKGTLHGQGGLVDGCGGGCW